MDNTRGGGKAAKISPSPMQEGFVRLSRSYFEHYLWQERREFSKAEAWLDCVQSATFRPYKTLVNGELIEIPRGGFVASERYLSDRWMWSRTKLRAFLDLLTSDGMISRKKTTHNTLVLLCNFDRFNPEKDREKTSGEPPGDQRGTKEEEDKEEKIYKERENARASLPTAEEVKAHGRTLVPPADENFCLGWFEEMEGSGWIDRQHRPVHPEQWKMRLSGAWRGAQHSHRERAARAVSRQQDKWAAEQALHSQKSKYGF